MHKHLETHDRILFSICIVVVVIEFAFPQAAYATTPTHEIVAVDALRAAVVVAPPEPAMTESARLTTFVTVTAYSSTVDQTDDTPYITAAGTFVRDGVVAANFLPIGTRMRLPDYFGDKVFIVEDRMNERYWYRIDLWMPERALAKTWGLRRVRVELL